MFTKPDLVQFDRSGYVLHGCPECTMKPVTLVMVTPEGERAEYDLLCCDRLPGTYLADLHGLYAGRGVGEAEGVPGRVRSVTSLEADAIAEPSLWADCILWSRCGRGRNGASLEVFVKRAGGDSRLYHAAGAKGNVWVSSQDTIKVHENTVRLLCGEAVGSCSDPKIFFIGKK